MKHNWTYYIGPMGVRYRVDHENKIVQIDAGKRGWMKSTVTYTQFIAHPNDFGLFCRPGKDFRE